MNSILFYNFFPTRDIFIISHDFLDGTFVIWTISNSVSSIFDFASVVESFMGGVPLNFLALNDFDIFTHLYGIIDPFLALAIHQIFFKLIGFLGMYLLISKILSQNKQASKLIGAIVAFYFAMLPVWPSVLSGIMVMPFTIWAVINLYLNFQSVKYWTVLIVSALYTNIIFTGFYLIPILLLLGIWAFIANKKDRSSILLIGLVFLAFTLLGNLRIIYAEVAGGIESHRASWAVRENIVDLSKLDTFVFTTYSLLKHGHYHFYSLQYAPLLASIGAMVVAQFSIEKIKENKNFKLLIMVIFMTLFVSFVSGLLLSGVVNLSQFFGASFQLRIYSALPFMWSLVLALSLAVIYESKFYNKNIIIYLILFVVITQSVRFDASFLPKINNKLRGAQETSSTIGFMSTNAKNYYKIDTFNILRENLKRTSQNPVVLSVGFDPMISAYNGINTLDGYSSSYPLQHKENFRKIIELELEKDVGNKKYFDEWGNRAYMFYSDSKNLEFNYCQATNLGATHIISTLNIPTIEQRRIFTLENFIVYDLGQICER